MIISLICVMVVTPFYLSFAQVNDNCTKKDANKVISQWNKVFGHETSDAAEFFVGYTVFAPSVNLNPYIVMEIKLIYNTNNISIKTYR